MRTLAPLAALGELTGAPQRCARHAADRQDGARPRPGAGPLRLPDHRHTAAQPDRPEIERSIIYSVARTESAFDQRDKSPANAVGLMQVTPEAGRDTAKRFGVTYDWDRMVSDPVYNTQMGAAELARCCGNIAAPTS